MKKVIVMLLAGALAISAFAACTGEETPSASKDDSSAVVSNDASTVASEEAKTVDMNAVLEQIKADFKAEEKREISADDIYQETGIDPETYTSHFWLTEISGLSSEKAVMFMAKDENAASAIKQKLDIVLQSETAQMKDYNADNYAMLQKAVVEQKGLYVYLLVSPNVDKFVATVNSAF